MKIILALAAIAMLAGRSLDARLTAVEQRAAKADGVEWVLSRSPLDNDRAVRLSTGDKQDIVMLAGRLGVTNISRVELEFTIPGARPYLDVRGDESVDDRRRTWQQLTVSRRDWGCRSGLIPATRVGRWCADPDSLSTHQQWRIQRGDSALDIEYRDGVSYDVAAAVVDALSRRAIVWDLIPQTPPFPALDCARDSWCPKMRLEDLTGIRPADRSSTPGTAFELVFAGFESVSISLAADHSIRARSFVRWTV